MIDFNPTKCPCGCGKWIMKPWFNCQCSSLSDSEKDEFMTIVRDADRWRTIEESSNELLNRAIAEWRKSNQRNDDWDCEDYIDPNGVRELIFRFVRSVKERVGATPDPAIEQYCELCGSTHKGLHKTCDRCVAQGKLL